VDRLRSALDALPVGVVLVDAAGVVRTTNAAALHLGGAAHGDVLVREAVDKHVAQALRGSSSGSTIELFGPPKRVLHVQAVALAEGGALVAIEDTSERARLDAVRTDFVANISHELKTPVGALAVLAETLADEDDIEIVHRLATKVVDEAHRAGTAIDDLLELSRIELGGRAVREPRRRVDGAARRRRPGRRPREQRSISIIRARSVGIARVGRADLRPRGPPPARLGALQPRRERGEVQRGGVRGAPRRRAGG
jgi:two-component system sensor histidine kinase SenX3